MDSALYGNTYTDLTTGRRIPAIEFHEGKKRMTIQASTQITDWRGAEIEIGDKVIYRGRYSMVEALVEEVKFSVTKAGTKTTVFVRPTSAEKNRWWTPARHITMKYATKVTDPIA